MAAYNKSCEPIIQRIMDLKISETDFSQLSQLKNYVVEKYGDLESLEKKVGTDNVKRAFMFPIFNHAYEVYNEIKEQNESWGGRINSPHFFAYAIAINFIPKEDVAHINFDSGLSIDKFVSQNFVDVPKELSNYLFNQFKSTIVFSANSSKDVSVDYSEKRA